MLSLLLGAFLVSADDRCKCTRENNGAPGRYDMDLPEDYGMYCKAWDLTSESCVGVEKAPEWCTEKWCYVSKDCPDANPSVVFKNDTDLFWAYGHCEGEPATCMAYSKPRPKIRPCPDEKDTSSPCKGKKRAMCMKDDCCEFDRKEKMCVSSGKCDDEAPCKDCGECKENLPSPPTVKNNLPWGGTQSPDYWYNCVARWCSKYVWMGGAEQCHYETKYGCGCEDMKYSHCMTDKDCCWAGSEHGCQEKVECPRLTFEECLANSDRCAPCGNGGCSYKCQMGPGQKLSGFQSLVLDNNCMCKVTQMF